MSSFAPLLVARALTLAALLPSGDGLAVAATGARRELTTDRPDSTESPFTIEPGHVQAEMDFANYTRDRSGGTTATQWEAAPLNLRVGVAADLEVGIFVTPFQRQDERTAAGPRTRSHGFGDLVWRTKLNLFGNDGGGPALGAIADVKLPTASGGLGNGKFEAEFIVPVAFALPDGWSAGAMTGVALVHDGTSYQAVWGNTFTCGRELATDLAGFLEVTSSAGSGPHVASFNAGLTRRFGRDLQFDVGVNLGLSRQAPDSLIFAGLARRF